MKIRHIVLFLFGCIEIFAQDVSSGKKIISEISTTKYHELAPSVSADGKRMVFESNTNEKKGWELFESQLSQTGLWSTPVPLTSINEKCNFLAGPSISYDGNRLYYTAFIEGISQSEDIYYSDRTGENSWSSPISIGIPINTEDNYEGFPSISSDGNSIYFIRINMEKGLEQKDKEPCFVIFVSKKMSDGKWDEPVPLPAPINMGCERDPKIMADNRTLIFSSIREGGKGKYDMYQSTKQDDQSWTDPVALDFINSTDNDQSPCISASGENMMFYTKNDIYTIPIPEKYRQNVNTVVQGKVSDSNLHSVVKVQIKVSNLTTGYEFATENSTVDGEFSFVLSAGSKYSIKFNNESFLPDSITIDLQRVKNYQLIRRDILLKSSAEISINVIDKDLHKPVSTWLNVSQATKVIYNDSLSIVQQPLKLTFEFPFDYHIRLSKDQYTQGIENWIFKERRTKFNPKLMLSVEHEKVAFVANVISVTTKQKVKVKVYIQNKGEDELIIAIAGESVLLRKGDKYQIITASEEGYFFSQAEIVAGAVDSIELITVPIELHAQLTLNNITFESNSSELKSTSQFELDRIFDLMKVNPKLVIEISAYTDDVGEKNINLILSEKRARSAWTYLINKGVTAERLVPKGYGESRHIAPNDTKENRAKNRRVELRVLKVS